MQFADRIKKEMSEGIIRALLEDAGYRVIDSGIEKILREVSCLPPGAYGKLGYPNALRRLPDFTVMNREQTEKHLVEVKYRTRWDRDIFDKVQEQVSIFGELILVSVNAEPPPSLKKFKSDPSGEHAPSRYLRCCKLRCVDGRYQIELKDDEQFKWCDVEAVPEENLWWRMVRLQTYFPAIVERKDDQSLIKAVKALQGILDTSDTKLPESAK